MAGQGEHAKKNEIDDLLRQAQAAGGASPSANPPNPTTPQPEVAADASGGTLDQSEIDRLLSGSGSPSPAGATSSRATEPSAGVKDASEEAVISQEDIDLLLAKAEDAIASIDQPAAEAAPGFRTFDFRDFSGAAANQESATLELMRDVQLDLTIELGRTHMQLEDVLKLKQGAVVPLDKLAGDPADIYVNGRLIARGEVLVLNDNFCVRVADLIAGQAAAENEAG
ncbi:MAG: flagellar motor switch protein FliN [Planctomycetota bacterium]